MVDGNDSVLVVPEGGVFEAGVASLACLGPGEHTHRRVVGVTLLSHRVVTSAVEVVLHLVKGEDVHVPVQMAVTAWEESVDELSTLSEISKQLALPKQLFMNEGQKV